jgi:hypothetical protein
MLRLMDELPSFRANGIRRCFKALWRARRHIWHRYTSILIPLDRFTFDPAPCGIWRWAAPFGFEKQARRHKKVTAGNRKVSETSKAFKVRPPTFLFHTLLVCVALGRLAAQKHKSKVIEMVSQIGFYWLNEIKGKLLVDLWHGMINLV